MNPKQQYKRNQALLRQIQSADLKGMQTEIESGAQLDSIADEALQKIAPDFDHAYKKSHPAILKLLFDSGADPFTSITIRRYMAEDREVEIAKLIVESGKPELIDLVHECFPDFDIETCQNSITEEDTADKEDQEALIPLVDFTTDESYGNIKKEDILILLENDFVKSEKWLDRFKSFTGSAQTHRAVLDFLVEEILLDPAVFERDDWREAAKSIVDCMVDYDVFASNMYGMSLEEFKAYDGDDEGGAPEIYADENYSLTDLIVKLLCAPYTFTRNQDDWFDVFEYYCSTFEKRAPFDTSQDDDIAELMHAPFLQGNTFGDKVKSCCKKYFKYAEF